MTDAASLIAEIEQRHKAEALREVEALITELKAMNYQPTILERYAAQLRRARN